jgi:hypothetical protein
MNNIKIENILLGIKIVLLIAMLLTIMLVNRFKEDGYERVNFDMVVHKKYDEAKKYSLSYYVCDTIQNAESSISRIDYHNIKIGQKFKGNKLVFVERDIEPLTKLNIYIALVVFSLTLMINIIKTIHENE